MILTPIGSSPLARGLLGDDVDEIVRDGIIPARAGFTQNDGLVSFQTRDHPRSRGVYSGLDVYFHNLRGSSPLARGLLEHVLIVGVDDRIIPARAGFTEAMTNILIESGDHPRSRGVYFPHE